MTPTTAGFTLTDEGKLFADLISVELFAEDII
jgi:hypothetical protein